MYVSICHVSICSPNSLCAYLYWEREKMHIRMFLQHQIIPFVQCTYDTPILLFWSYRVQCFYTSELIPCNKCLGMWHTPNTHSLALIQYLYILWMSPIPANFDWAITMAREGATTENDIEMEKMCSGWLPAWWKKGVPLWVYALSIHMECLKIRWRHSQSHTGTHTPSFPLHFIGNSNETF